MSELELGYPSHDPTLDAAVVGAPEYLEGAAVAPVVVPGVGHQPVRGPLLLPPAQQTDGVAAQGFAGNVLVNSGLVVGEVLEHSEGGLGGTVSHQLHLDLLHVSLDGVTLLAERFVLEESYKYQVLKQSKVHLGVRDVIAGVVAPPVTFRRGGPLGARLPGPIDVVLAWLDDVGLTALLTPVLASTHQAFPGPVGPGCTREP